jgi:hypothetical protein
MANKLEYLKCEDCDSIQFLLRKQNSELIGICYACFKEIKINDAEVSGGDDE